MVMDLEYDGIAGTSLNLYTNNLIIIVPGSVNGVIHIYDIKAGCLVRDLTVHNCQIRGIEWTSLHSMITHACESLNGSQGKSELAFINIKSGMLSTLNNNNKT